ncbi:Lrp/AsnC family transcriptional regulator [Thermococcus sibiricus]|jgi:DNA-binding Lrp family transcriptional regulator|uniref:Transcription regulator, putative n=1 Tax=Thermococcus sibiricus TaxID=172049 RepID=A0A101EJS7_9EURY|nr:Lrp/AsnC family transcriptional regulator [Thermococcus sibiricus]KUK16636.1 MAG: Transcription regulator, putative [Thermococcus sibiricus]
MNERFRYPISNDELNFWRKAFGGVLDDLDFKIYFLLRENGRMSDTEMAKRLNVSATTVRRRRLFLQERGYLQIIGILILQELNLAYADVLVKFEKTASEKDIEKFINDAKQNYRIFEIAEYAGRYDVLLRFFERNLHSLARSVHEFISKYPYISEYEILPVTQSPKAFAKRLK